MVVPFPTFTTSVRRTTSSGRGKWSAFNDLPKSPTKKKFGKYASMYTGAFFAIGGGLAIMDRLIVYWTGELTTDEKVKDVKLDTSAILHEIRGHRSEWLRAYHERQAGGGAAAATAE
ncbi:hypothetical protein POM88_046423 [Heracleum sosnowskyi]|uniref:Uncharacterized protein n=1 Tax=Heracleum sosnowskyi TaxID=360622 RepID=A0AAD8H908_9APIA|nr:hypothetical protein POM88_046423 [Heracleum sosnowskyi]